MPMLDPRRTVRSATRGARTSRERPGVEGAATGPMSSPMRSALAQGQALAGDDEGEDQRKVPAFLRAGYQAGGFEGVRGAVQGQGTDWYSLPEWQRTKILEASRED